MKQIPNLLSVCCNHWCFYFKGKGQTEQITCGQCSQECETYPKQKNAPIKLGKGSKVRLPNGYVGIITRIRKDGIAWVKVQARWGGFSKKITSKTFKYSLNELTPFNFNR